MIFVLLWLFLWAFVIGPILVILHLLLSKEERKSFRRTFLFLFLSPFPLILILFIVGFIFEPVSPDRGDIIGHYEIDRDQFPGPRADWQHQIYSFEIDDQNLVLRDQRTKTIWTYPIEWFDADGYHWRFSNEEERHHMLREGPTIVRESFGHYYVFESSLYGNVFFKKKPWWHF